MKIEKTGVVGAGIMGTGLALTLLLYGKTVFLIDSDKSKLEIFENDLIKNIRFQILFNAEWKDIVPDKLKHNLITSTNPEILNSADYIIENVTEDWEIKKELWEKLDSICKKETIFASNTSAIPITKQASVTKRPDKVIGIHFMNPVPLKPVVEVIKSELTSDETIKNTLSFLEEIGKRGILINDAPGFVSNRVLMLTINEAFYLLQEGTASISEIDEIFKTCFGHKMGPFETADLIGLDTILLTLKVLKDNLKDSKFTPCPLLRTVVDKGFFGAKNKKTIYQYFNLNN
ncbi:MAG: 3-hydroxybutyryl-CoA dehydrogenase [Prolixibacteraceae bacterium]|nr:3-hydroxybutyryl-CoA dehydrogenase [Prolixibacteraceae bacterium]